MKTNRRAYDHRIKQAIIRTRNIDLFPELKIPKTTAKNWIHRGIIEVVTVDVFDLSHENLKLKCIDLETQSKALQAHSGPDRYSF